MSAAATAKVTVRLLDQFTAPSRIVQNSMRAMLGNMRALSGARIGIGKQLEAATARAKELRSSLMGIGATSLVAAYSVKRLMKSGIDLETVMMDIRQKADLTSEATAAMRDRILQIAPTVNKSAGEVAKGVDFLMSAGLDPARAMEMIPAIGKAATAFGANIEDIAKSSYAAIDNLKVPAKELARTLDIMAAAGNAGSFELKDMAQYFPQLTAAAEALGMRGNTGVARLAAALQIARKGAGDASSAATNTANAMQKIVSPETTKKFRKFGIDIRKELKKTQESGGDVFEMLVNLTRKAVKGDISKLGDLFEDAQVQNFLRPMIANPDEYKKIRDKSAAADGVVEDDYRNRMTTLAERLNRLMNAFDTLTIKISDALAPWIGALADKVAPLVDYVSELAGKYPGYTAAIVGVTTALAGLAATIAVVRLLAAGLAIVGLKGASGLLNYLAPKAPRPGQQAPGAVPTSAPKAGAAEATPKIATKPGPMRPSQLETARQGIARMNAPATALGRLVGGLKNGVVGALAYYFGSKAIDAGFDALPKPNYPKGYDPDAEMNMGIVDRVKRLWNGSPDSEKPIGAPDANAPDAVPAPNAKPSGVAAGTGLGQGIKEGLAGQRPAVMDEVDAMIAAVQARLAAAGLKLSVTPQLEGGGAALRSLHSDAGF
ncbi:MAG: phage tail tape measure protein [Bosea sp.]|uniref:phage tail tape measure protein n=1 Tax=unclassified Bosea (in: a-proteobacteria) TaxID=2653178 RepID=UPI00095E4559|nr:MULTISPECIES: phage tail tape measure protein [unclassified Bosea (in: a-proteobacteria)]MBN9457376.1 phage tail tape measure protein [Bosea sp. (in: a-proteobacteria)]OJV09638.1 MAG: phage tail tape measure protein [Bosea sp. 67-29]